MKKILIFMLLLLWSCDPGHILDPPYQSEWFIINNTNRDLLLYWEEIIIDDATNEYADVEEYLLVGNQSFYQLYIGSKETIVEFAGLFRVRSGVLKSCRFYLTPSDSDEILKEWVMGADNGEHDLFDESQWEHRSWERPQSYYTIYHNAWTFTLTEADIAVTE